jgi:hypothetical protein
VSIFFLPYVHCAADDLWLIPYAARQDPDVFEINVSNANGAELLLAIGLYQRRMALTRGGFLRARKRDSLGSA